jgi:hypothetical protein
MHNFYSIYHDQLIAMENIKALIGFKKPVEKIHVILAHTNSTDYTSANNGKVYTACEVNDYPDFKLPNFRQ